jgi:cytochrome b
VKSIKPAPTSLITVWDLPIRLFHWLLAALIGFSWWSVENGHLDWHLWSGFGVMTLVLFRLLWGLVGSSTARFAGFVRGPREVSAYVRDMRGWSGIGHSPLGALSVIAMLALLLVQIASGLISSDDDGLAEGPLAPLVSLDVSDLAHEVHEIAFNLLLAMIALHVAAILYYRFVLGKKIIRPMLTGAGEAAAGARPMRPARLSLALACLAIAIAVTRWVIAGVPPFGP